MDSPISLRSTRSVLGVAIIWGSLVGCQAVTPPEKLSIAGIETSSASSLLYIADKQHFFDTEGLQVNFHYYLTSDAALKALHAGKDDLAVSSETSLVYDIMGGAKTSIFSIIAVSTKFPGMLVNVTSHINQAQDLKGKRIGVTLGSNTDYFLDAMLTLGGLDHSDAQIIPLQPDQMLEALTSGRVDAVAVPPLRLLEIQNALNHQVAILTDNLIYTTFVCMATTPAYLNGHGPTLQKFLKALLKAKSFIDTNPEASKQILVNASHRSRQIVDQVWMMFRYGPELTQDLVIALKDEARWISQRQLVKNTSLPNFETFLSLDALQSVAPSAVSVIQ